mmetsp:Transcript_10360/g.15190  ORF Transcript_10360/g.15190 Transcript_10360/m.15190 type:complete len:254 (-) Transcript_10360:770-1531(-)
MIILHFRHKTMHIRSPGTTIHKAIIATHIPMNSCPVDVLRCRVVGVSDFFHPSWRMVFVVIKGEKLNVRVRSAQLGSKVVLDKVAFNSRIIRTRFPWSRKFGFVLDSNPPDGYTKVVVRGDKFAKVKCPRLCIERVFSGPISKATRLLRTGHTHSVNSSRFVFIRRFLHPCGRTPWADKNIHAIPFWKRLLCNRVRLDNHIYHAAVNVVLNACVKFSKLKVSIYVVERVGFEAEIARIHVDAGHAVAETRFAK